MTKPPTPPPLAQKTLQADPTTRFEASIHMGKNGSPYSTLLRSSLKNHAWLASKPVYIYANAFQTLFENLRFFLADFDPANATPPEWSTIKDLGPWISSATPGNWFFHAMLPKGTNPAILGITQRFPKNPEILPRTLYVKYPEIGALLDFLNELQGELAKHAPAPTRKNKPRPFVAPPAANAPAPESEGSSFLRETPATYSISQEEAEELKRWQEEEEARAKEEEREYWKSSPDPKEWMEASLEYEISYPEPDPHDRGDEFNEFMELEWGEMVLEKRFLIERIANLPDNPIGDDLKMKIVAEERLRNLLDEMEEFRRDQYGYI
jgi:hypothetical protein